MKQIDLSNIKKETIQNHTSKGNQPKWHIDHKWYKADHMGYEALSEYIVSEFLKKSNVENFVAYDIVRIKYDEKESMGCVSSNFKGKDEMLISLEKLHRMYFGKGLAETIAIKESAEDKLTYTVDFVEKNTGIKNVGKYISAMLAVDAVFLNEDRHTNNIAVIRDEKTKSFRMAPIFDNGLALLSDTNDYPVEKDIYENITKVYAKPFDRSFDVQLDAAEALYGSHLEFFITREDVYRILDRISEAYDHKIIHRVETVLLEQMRKYSVFFK